MGTRTWTFQDRREVLFKSPNEAENIQGQHSGHVLVTADEASKFEDEAIGGAINSLLSAGQTAHLLTGNPIKGYGLFFDSFNDEAARYGTPHYDFMLRHSKL